MSYFWVRLEPSNLSRLRNARIIPSWCIKCESELILFFWGWKNHVIFRSGVVECCLRLFMEDLCQINQSFFLHQASPITTFLKHHPIFPLVVVVCIIDVDLMLLFTTFGPHDHTDMDSRGGHSIIKLKTTWKQNYSTFFKLHQQNGSNFYQKKIMSTYTWYLLHSTNW